MRSPTDSHAPRLRLLNSTQIPHMPGSVVYIMSRDQRVQDNHALATAQAMALELGLPLTVAFCLQSGRSFRAREHFQLMLDGLRQVERDLAALSIPFMLFVGEPFDRMSWFAHHVKPAAVFVDFSPLRGPRRLHAMLADALNCPLYQVDTHNVVPVWVASDKAEVGARTLRPKIHRALPQYLVEPPKILSHPHRWPGVVMPMSDLQKLTDSVLDKLPSNGISHTWGSGEHAALGALEDFVSLRLRGYAHSRNDPSLAATSDLSPYLHFGQLSSLRVALRVLSAVQADASLQIDADALLEELIVRKELSDNWCLYGPGYTRVEHGPAWAEATLAKHMADPRPYVYSRLQLERAETHDAAWNASQRQLTRTGKMHGYMRMYWAKKVLEWSHEPQEVIDSLIYLNDFYSIDGGDPNGYVGILWSVAGLHDRPWGERQIYGTVRSMVYAGLKRKFDVEAYIAQNS